MADCCLAESKYYVGDVGTQLLIDTCTALAAATSVALQVRKPDGTTVTWTGAVSGLTSIAYVTQANDWDQAGTYYLQAYVQFAGGVAIHGDTVTFRVLARYA